MSILQAWEEEDEEMFESPGVYQLYMSGDVQMQIRTPKPSICMLWNGNKIKTFDGVTYSHELFCSHVLVQDYKEGSFNVILRSCPYDSVQPCPHALEIFLQNEQFTFENDNGEVKMFTTKKKFPIPVQISGLKVTRSGLDVRILLESIPLTITWDSKVMYINFCCHFHANIEFTNNECLKKGRLSGGEVAQAFH